VFTDCPVPLWFSSLIMRREEVSWLPWGFGHETFANGGGLRLMWGEVSSSC